MSNNVVLGPLADYKGDDVLNCGISPVSLIDTGVNPTISSSTVFRGKFRRLGDNGNIQYILDISPPSDNGFLVRFPPTNSTKLEFVIWTTGGVYLATNTLVDILVGDLCEFEIRLDGGFITISVNGMSQQYPYTGTPLMPSTGTLKLFNDYDGEGNPAYVQMYNMEITGVLQYSTDGSFGDASLIDTSGNGNNGVLVDCQWWKSGGILGRVDEVYATEQLYKNTWAVPMDENQKVVDLLKNYPVEDPFWNPYNQDPTFSFEVFYQTSGITTYKYNYSYSYTY